jgi:hypothetical protein
MFNDNSSVMGTLNIVLRGENGRVKKHKTVRNKVMNQGLAHIVGRMLDSTESSYGYNTGDATQGQGYAGGTQGSKAEAGRIHLQPKMMRYMGLGLGQAGLPQGQAATASGNKTGDEAGHEWCLEREVTNGPVPMFGLYGVTTGTTAVETEAQFVGGSNSNSGRCDMSPYAGGYADPASFTVIYQGDKPTGGTLLSPDTQASDATGYGASDNAEGSYLQGTFTTPGIGVPITDSQGQTTARTLFSHSPATYYQNIYKDKKQGTRLVYVAVFPPNCPDATNEVGIVEAGIFNGQSFSTDTTKPAINGGTLRAQTMLCRTTFSVVTKTANDTLQITWSIQFQDNTT